MKYCSKCGNELLDDAVICPKCGCAVEGMRNPEAVDNRSGLQTAAKIFMIIGCIAIGWCLIPLAWCIPDDCVVLRQNGTRRTRKHRV